LLSDDVLRFVLGVLPSAPARVLEVGAGAGELAAALGEAGYEVLAIDPEGEPPVVPVALLDLDEPDESFDAAVAVVSLHHVEPFDESIAKLARLLRPGAVLVVDELDVEELDERATGWWVERRRELGLEAPDDPREMVDEMRAHIHPVRQIYDVLGEFFELGPLARGSYLHRWHLDLELHDAEEALIESGELPAVGVRFSGRRQPGRS
jgi:SAM-dependent methyltransferase